MPQTLLDMLNENESQPTPAMMRLAIAEIERLRALLLSCRRAMAASNGYTDWQHMIKAIDEMVNI